MSFARGIDRLKMWKVDQVDRGALEEWFPGFTVCRGQGHAAESRGSRGRLSKGSQCPQQEQNSSTVLPLRDGPSSFTHVTPCLFGGHSAKNGQPPSTPSRVVGSFFSPAAESFGVSAQIGSGVVRGGPEDP